MSNDILKTKRILYLSGLISKMKEAILNNKSKTEKASKTFIYGRIADYTYYSEVSIRKFLSGSIPKDISSLLDGLVAYSKYIGVEEAYIDEFIKGYTEACNSVILDLKTQKTTKTNLLSQDFSSIIRTEKLTEFLDDFLENKVNIAYIYGYKLAGKSKSVGAFIYDLMSKNIYDNIIWYDINNEKNQQEELIDKVLDFLEIENKKISLDVKKQICFSTLKNQANIIVLDIQDNKLKYDFINLLKELSLYSKIIIISSIPVEKYEEDFAYYVRKFSIIGFMNKEEFKQMLNSSNKLRPILTTNEEFVDKVYAITGGLPFASLHIFGRIIDANKYGESLENIIDNYSEFKEEEYEVLAQILISQKWDELSLLAKKIMVAVAKFDFTVSIRLVANICKVSMVCEEWKKAINELYENDLLGYITLNRPRFTMNNMIRTLIRIKAKKEKIIDDNEFLDIIAREYIYIAEDIGECYDEIYKLQRLDDIDEFNIVTQVLEYLCENNKEIEYITIVRNLKYYIYVRGKWVIGENSLHLKRANLAKKINNYTEELEAYCDYINIMSKSRNREEAEKYLIIANNIKDKYSENIEKRVLCLCNHVNALYLYNCLEDYENAYKLWEFNEKNYFEYISEYRRLVNNLWSNRCYLKFEKDLSKVEKLFITKVEEMREKRFLRAAIDYNLLLIAVLIKEYTLEKDERFLVRAKQFLLKAENMLLNSKEDIRNEATFYKLSAIIAAYSKNDLECIKFLEKACMNYEKMNCYEDIENLKNDIEKIKTGK